MFFVSAVPSTCFASAIATLCKQTSTNPNHNRFAIFGERICDTRMAHTHTQKKSPSRWQKCERIEQLQTNDIIHAAKTLGICQINYNNFFVRIQNCVENAPRRSLLLISQAVIIQLIASMWMHARHIRNRKKVNFNLLGIAESSVCARGDAGGVRFHSWEHVLKCWKS